MKLLLTYKESLFDAVEWGGFEDYDEYPYWLAELIDLGHIYATPMGNFYANHKSDSYLDVGGMFIINPWGDVKYYSTYDFHEQWHIVSVPPEGSNIVVTPKDKIFEAVEWTGYSDYMSYPTWFQDLMDKGYVYREFVGDLSQHAEFFSSPDGDLALSRYSIFVVNGLGQIKMYDDKEMLTNWLVVDEVDNDESHF